ncbi:MAG TPA: sigma-70 family RNA polymerase sigma factor [Planctomycetota bacterium]|nr:sigma-70 family RNA polymerase sigma factor [Planctomycetota bacterium]
MADDPSSLLLAGRLDELLPLVYDDLRQVAAAILYQERPGHSLQPTALVNEAYLRLIDATKVEWQGRAQFFALAGRLMRQILVDHARSRGAAKRGGDRVRVSLVDESGGLRGPQELDLLDVDEALEELSALDPRKARVIELRFFAGLEMREIAEVLRIGMTTAEDDWYFARAWLRRRLGDRTG